LIQITQNWFHGKFLIGFKDLTSELGFIWVPSFFFSLGFKDFDSNHSEFGIMSDFMVFLGFKDFDSKHSEFGIMSDFMVILGWGFYLCILVFVIHGLGFAKV
jgi:hypothetical protein